ncbi:ribonuclease H-like domain-containing protein [Tanacetum coccineum]
MKSSLVFYSIYPKANLEIVAYQLGLESVDAQLIVHQKNEAVYEEKIAVLEFEVKDKGYGLFNSVFDSRSSNGDDNRTNDRSTSNKTSASVSQVETSNTPPSNTSVEMPRLESVRPNGVIIEDWVSDDDEDIFQSNDSQTIVKPSFKRIEFTKARNEPVKSDKQAIKPRIRMPKESVLGKVTVLTRSGRIPVSTAKQVSKVKVNTVKVNGVNTAGQTAVSTVKGNGVTAVKASAGCVWRPKMTDLNNGSKDNSGSWISKRGNPQQALKYKGMFDSGCSRHMTGNKALLTDYQDIDGGFVAFGGSTRGGKITGIGKIRTNKIDFEDVFFVKELKFNLFSVSQMCDKKNSVLFTETECLVLSPDFKLIDESQVLLRVPRQNNMYSFDLKNVVPSGDLTCLFAKATIDESKLWHRRLGHVNFKTMNKLVKGNLVRGLPSKTFENDHTCVACQKGKQHKASCKTKHVSSISQPLQMLHMDLFGPTSVRRINHKTYCLIVTDDFSRFSRITKRKFHETFWMSYYYHTLDPLGKFDGKAEEGFLVGARTNWLFDIDSLTNSMNCQPVTLGNQTNKNAGPQETNGNIGLKKNVDVGQTKEENVSTQQYIVFPLWSSISSCYKSSDDKAEDDTVDDVACKKTIQESANKYDHALKNVLDKIMDQEKEASEQLDAVRKEFEAQCNSKLLQEKITRTSSTNNFNTVSTPVNTASTSKSFSPVGPSSGPSFVPFVGSFPIDVANIPHDPLMHELEDTAEIQSTGIFGNAYDDHDLETLSTLYADQSVSVEADFNKMEPSTVISPIPTTRVHSIHPKAHIIGNLKSAVQTRGMTKKNSRKDDTAEIQSTSIFGNADDDHDLETLNTPYADQSVGAEVDFNNMKPSIVVTPIPTARVHSTHPKA